MRKPTSRKSAFSLLELMIAVAIIAGIAAIAIPAYQKYMFDAKEAQMVSALGMLHKDMERVKMDYLSRDGVIAPATQYLYSETQPYLMYRPGGAPKFNVITGALTPPPITDPNAKFALSQFPEWSYLAPEPGAIGLNDKFGVKLLDNGRYSVLYGAEFNMDGDSNYHVLAIDERGNYFKLCDDFSNSSPGSQNYVAWSDGIELNCMALTASSDSNEGAGASPGDCFGDGCED